MADNNRTDHMAFAGDNGDSFPWKPDPLRCKSCNRSLGEADREILENVCDFCCETLARWAFQQLTDLIEGRYETPQEFKPRVEELDASLAPMDNAARSEGAKC